MREEGWYTDPFGLHERRWFSDGVPTKLVSDNGITSNDPAPNTRYVLAPKPIEDSTGLTVEAGSTHEDAGVNQAWEAFVESGGD
jgi:hypothetical protein